MALEASHMRFALDLKNRLGVVNLAEYLNGAVYPDSRYVTKTAREETHPTDYLNDPKFMQDDFHKGWFTHLLLDDLQFKAMLEVYPEIEPGKIGEFDDVWMFRTSLKVLQDWSDSYKFDIKKYLPYVANPSKNPNGESSQSLQDYYDVIINLYKDDPQNLSSDDYIKFWKVISKPEIGEKLSGWTEKLHSDPQIVNRVDQLYPKALELAEQIDFSR